MFFELNASDFQIKNQENEFPYYSYITSTKQTGFKIKLHPTIGYFLFNKFVVGSTINLFYEKSSTEIIMDNSNGSVSYNDAFVGLSPFLRFYFINNEKNLFYLNIYGGINKSLFKNQEMTQLNIANSLFSRIYSTYNYKELTTGLTVGYNYKLTEKLLLNTAIGYNFSKINQTEQKDFKYVYGQDSRSDEYSMIFHKNYLILNLGFTLILGKNEN